MGFGIFKPPGDGRALFLKLRDGSRCVAFQRLFADNIAGKRGIQPFELGEPSSDGVAPRPSRGELVSELMPLLAQLGQRLAPVGQGSVGFGMRRLRPLNRAMDFLYFVG